MKLPSDRPLMQAMEEGLLLPPAVLDALARHAIVRLRLRAGESVEIEVVFRDSDQ